MVGVLGVRSFSWPTWCGIWTSLTLDFMAASSYGAGTTSSGLVNIRLDLHDDIAGRDVLLVEDILDTGNTLSCPSWWPSSRDAIPPP